MKQNFTLNQLTRLLYEETTPEETSMLLELTALCTPLGEQFEEMRSNKQILDELVLHSRFKIFWLTAACRRPEG